jgi:hypothetical protein
VILFKVAKFQLEWLIGPKKGLHIGNDWSMRIEECLSREGNWCHLPRKKRKIAEEGD